MVMRTRVLCGVVALALGGCTVLFPTVGVIRANMNADVNVDEHGCERSPAGVERVPCTHPGPVEYRSTIVENALVGFVADLAAFVALAASAPHFTSDNIF